MLTTGINEKLILNPGVKFFDHNGGRYAFLAQHPYPLSYISLNKSMESLLNKFDGWFDFTEHVPSSLTNLEFQELILKLREIGLLLDKEPPIASAPDASVATLWLFPTSDCNLRCQYCYASAGDNPKITVTPDIVRSAVKYFFKTIPDNIHKATMMFHGGGEATTAFEVLKQSWEIFRREADCHKLNRSIAGTTNGAFGKEVLDWMISEKVKAVFSLDGPEEIHDRQRPTKGGGGSWETVKKNIVSMVEKKLQPVVHTTITQTSISEIDKIVTYVNNLGINSIHLEVCTPHGRASTSDVVSEPDPEGFVTEFVKAMQLGLKIGINVSCSALTCLKIGNGNYCTVTEPTFAVTPEGFLSSCTEVSHSQDPASKLFFYGSVHEDGEVEIERDKEAFLRLRRGENVNGCGQCFLIDSCSGTCAIKAYRNKSDYFSKDPYQCFLTMNINAEIISKIADGEIVATPLMQSSSIKYGENEMVESSLPWMRLHSHIPPGHPARKKTGYLDRPFYFPDKNFSHMLLSMNHD